MSQRPSAIQPLAPMGGEFKTPARPLSPRASAVRPLSPRATVSQQALPPLGQAASMTRPASPRRVRPLGSPAGLDVAPASVQPVKSLEEKATENIPLTLVDPKGQQYVVNRNWASAQSGLIKTALTDSLASGQAAVELPVGTGLPFFSNPATLKWIVTYINHHQDKLAEPIEKPLRSANLADNVADKWDATFIDDAMKDGATSQDPYGKQFLYDLVNAANYLEMKGLLDIGAAKVATLLKGKPVEKVDAALRPACDLNAECPAGALAGGAAAAAQ